ncbi:type II secretion system F family protein [Novosphingobium sp.]|uniref:type II secretion system F family protein n=1 Tax=Novosphingobium sp. TaxID=1874826 RepID=UPI0035B4330C
MLELIAANPLIRYTVLLGIFGLVALAALTAMNFLDRRLATRGQLRAIGGTMPAINAGASLRSHNEGVWNKLVAQIEEAGLNLNDTKGDVLRDRLRAAGFDSPLAPRLYTLLRLGLVVILPTAFVLGTLASGQELTFVRLYVVGSICGAVGLLVPSLFVRIRADRRREATTNGFPDALDLILIAVEAGLGLEAALDRVAREMASSHPLVAQMLATATLRLRAGATREEALRQMAEEAGIEEIRAFSTLLIQSDKLGTSIGATLRVYASEMRERRRMRAEEKAHRLPVLLSVPLVVCMLPTMIGVLMLPAAVRVVRSVLPAMTGG